MVKAEHDSETRAEGQQVIVACAFIHHKFDGVEKVFLPKRADTKKFMPGVYELPGGHVDFGEDIKAGLRREIAEEFSKEITLGDPFATFTYTNDVKARILSKLSTSRSLLAVPTLPSTPKITQATNGSGNQISPRCSKAPAKTKTTQSTKSSSAHSSFCEVSRLISVHNT